jgi:hypothetical protein
MDNDAMNNDAMNNEAMNNEARVALLITSLPSDPNAVSDALEIAPTQVFRVGEILGKGPRRYTTAGWRLESPLDETVILERHVLWLLDQLPPDFVDRMQRVTRSGKRRLGSLWRSDRREDLVLRSVQKPFGALLGSARLSTSTCIVWLRQEDREA